jgi:hypothetical protein
MAGCADDDKAEAADEEEEEGEEEEEEAEEEGAAEGALTRGPIACPSRQPMRFSSLFPMEFCAMVSSAGRGPGIAAGAEKVEGGPILRCAASTPVEFVKSDVVCRLCSVSSSSMKSVSCCGA